MAGLYLHIPFCRSKCAYCDFYSVGNTKQTDDFVTAICKEMELQKDYLKGESIQTIYFGGGTPSILSINQIQEILNSIYKTFSVDVNNEITLEANPDDLTIEYLSDIKSIGINRLSIGLQSVDDDILKVMKRRHNSEQALCSVKNAQDVGFESISVDLIYGLPSLSLKNWERSIDEIEKLNVQHISAYHLTIEPNTFFHRLYKNGKLNLPKENESLDQFELLIEKMSEFGFLHYEISNFAKDGFLSLHNTNYWMGVKYLGLGPSAHSYNLTSREWNISNLQVYLSGIFQGKRPKEKEILSQEENFNDFIITNLRTMWGINIQNLENNFEEKFLDHFYKNVKNFLNDDLIKKNDSSFFLTKKGMFISDFIMEKLLY